MQKQLRIRFVIKTSVVGRKAAGGEVQEARILNRVIRVTDDGWEYEADQRHSDLIIRETGADKMSGLTHPGGEKKQVEEQEKSEELAGLAATRIRAVAARANYLATDRPDVEFAVKEICRKMAKPAAGDWQKLIRLGRYLKVAPRCVLTYPWQSEGEIPKGYSDSDWAGCRKSGKNTCGRPQD